MRGCISKINNMNTPKLGVEKPARLVEFKYFTNTSGPGGACPHAAEPNIKTITQALAYRQTLAQHPDWNHEIAVTVVEVCENAGYNWFGEVWRS